MMLFTSFTVVLEELMLTPEVRQVLSCGILLLSPVAELSRGHL